MPGYDYEFVSQVSEEYFCRICELPMRDPVQTKCGHRFCRECLLEANKRKIGQAECPMDRQPLDMEKETFDDKAAERSILSSTIKCPNSKCDWQGDLGNLRDHKPKCDYWMTKCTSCGVEKLLKEMEVHNQEECEWRKVSCPHCGEMIIARELENHNDVCSEFPVKCPNQCGHEMGRAKVDDHIKYHCPKSVVCCTYSELGCTFECPRKNLKKHLKNKAKDHLLLVLEHNKQFQEKIERRCDLLERNTSNFINKEELRKINQELKTQQRKYDKLTSDLKLTEKKTQLLNERNNKIKSSVESLKTGFSQNLERHRKQNERERKHDLCLMVAMIGMVAMIATLVICNCTTKINELRSENEERFETQRKNMDEHLEEKIKEHLVLTQQENEKLKTTLAEIKEQIIPRTNKFIWKINNFEENFKKAKETGHEHGMISDPFYTDRYGYKMRVLLDPNGNKGKNAGHVSVFIQILRGEYDAVLPWPFARKITVTLLDQKENLQLRKNNTGTLTLQDMLDNPECFRRPTTNSNSGYGFPNFISHEKLMTENYIVDDTIFVQVEVKEDYTGTE